MPSALLNLPLLLNTLEPFGVRWVMVGGMAVIVHGADELTKDVDMAISFDVENRTKLAEALAPLHPRPIRLAEGAAWEWDEKCIRAPWSIFATDAGRIDILVRLPGIDGFQGLWDRSEQFEIAGHKVHVASIADLIAMKSSAGREVDTHHIMRLRALEEAKAHPPAS